MASLIVPVAPEQQMPRKLSCSRDAALNLTVGQVREFYTAFKLFDRDGNGSISSDELYSVMRSMDLHPSISELEEFMQTVDTDKSGSIGFKEFCTVLATFGGVRKPTAEEEKQELMDAFRVFDRANSGYINAGDLRFIMGNLQLADGLTDADVMEMISEVDTDGDGRISFEEFAAALCEGTHDSDETVEQLIEKLDTLGVGNAGAQEKAVVAE